MVIVVKNTDAKAIVTRLKRLGEDAYIIGQCVKGRGGVKYV